MTAADTYVMRPPGWFGRAAPTLFTVLWLISGFGLYLSQTWIAQTCSAEVAGVAFLGHALGGAILMVVLLILILLRRRDARILLPMMLISGVMFFYGTGLFRRVGDQIAFSFIRAPYDLAVANMPSPVLMVFPWTDRTAGASGPSGQAIVYDEADSINLPGQHTWFVRNDRLARLMKGKPDRCMRFAEPHYYYCSYY